MSARKKAASLASPATSTAPWSIVIDSHTIPLVPATPALLGIEAVTGRTLYQHLLAASERAVPLRDMAIMLRFLSGPDCPIDGLKPPYDAGALGFRTRQDGGETAEAIVVRTGMMDVLAAIVQPLLAATKGQTDHLGALQLTE